MKPPIGPPGGDLQNCSSKPANAPGHDLGPAKRRPWRPPRRYVIEIGRGTNFNVVGTKIDANFFIS